MGALIGRLGTYLGAGLTTLFGSWKTIILVTLLSFAVIYAYNLICEVIQESLVWVTAQAGTVVYPGESTAFEFTGLVGYFMSVWKIPECMAFIISMVSIKFLLRKIPFLRW